MKNTRQEIHNPGEGLLNFDGLAHYPHISKTDRIDLFKERIHRAQSNPSAAVFMHTDANQTVQSAAIIERFDEGSQVFGIGMAHLQMFFFDVSQLSASELMEQRRDIFSRIERWLERNRIVHVATRIDTGDHHSAVFLQQQGFFIIETMTTYVRTKKHVHKPIKTLFTIEDFQPQHKSEVLMLCRGCFSESRFFRDPFLNNEKAEAYYEAWGSTLCREQDGIGLKVAVNTAKDVVGFVGYTINNLVRSVTGLVIRGSGLSAVSPNAPGAYLALIQETIHDETASTDMGEFKARVEHHQVIRAWQKLRCRQVHTEHTLHWIRQDF